LLRYSVLPTISFSTCDALTVRKYLTMQLYRHLELVDKFCYLGDMLSVDRDADAAVETRIRIAWNKFRQWVPLLTNKDISLTVRGRFCLQCFDAVGWVAGRASGL